MILPVHPLRLAASLREDIARYRRAYKLTTAILYGERENRKWRDTLSQSKLREMKDELERLSRRVEFDCFELAEIIESSRLDPSKMFKGKHGAHPTSAGRVVAAADEILTPNTPPELRWTNYGLDCVTKAFKDGDAKFFILLGERLDNLKRKQKPAEIDDGRYNVAILWRPEADWPGLAYCSNHVRIEICGLNLSKRNFDQLWRRDLQLRSAEHPIITEVRFELLGDPPEKIPCFS